MKNLEKIKPITSMREIRYSDLKSFRDLVDLSEGQENQEEFLAYNILDIFYGIKREDAKDLTIEKYNELLHYLGEALKEKPDLDNIIIMDGITYGLIPNFSKIKAGELIDMDALLSSNDLIQLMSVLYRPVIGEVNKKGEYLIEPYSEYDYRFEDIDAYSVESAMGFFLESFLNLKKISTLSSKE